MNETNPVETHEEKLRRQREIEQESVSLGASRYRGDRLEWHEAGDPTPRSEADLAPGKKLIEANMRAVAENITTFIETAASGRAGRKHAALPYLAHVDPLQAAYLTLRYMVVNAAGRGLFTDLAIQLGTALHEHLEMVNMASEHPGLYRRMHERLAEVTSSKLRLEVLRGVRRKYDINSLSWSKKEKLLVGSKLMELAIDALPEMFELSRQTRGRHNTPYYLQFTEATAEWLEKAHGHCELLSPIALPMIVKPRAWKTPYAGGYLTNLLRPRFVRTTNRAYLDDLGGVDLSVPMAAVNAIQETPWRINRVILEVLLEELERGGNVAGLPRQHDAPLPPRPAHIPTGVAPSDLPVSDREELSVWRAQAAKVHEENADARRDRVVLAQKLYVARRFADEEAIYFPHFLDFRGRVYPMPAYLNPQGPDVARGLLEFAEGKPLGEDGAFWLAAHIAGLWGIDKVSFEDRYAWVKENEEAILSSAMDPHEDGAFWKTAEKPFQALAACIDWLGYTVNGDAHVSRLPIAMDGSCSGLQHYSALLLDEVGGAAVNLVPSEQPSDVYTITSDRAQVLSDANIGGVDDDMARAWAEKISRKITKQPTMTLCYSATRFGRRNQIESALRKLDAEGPYLEEGVDRHSAARYMADIVGDALGDTVVAARRAMDWLKAVSDVTWQAGIPIRWTAPIGFPVMQDSRDLVATRVKVYVGGRRMDLHLKEDSPRLSKRRQASGIAPNFVHSLDASHLLSTVNMGAGLGLRHFAVIHDSFAVHAADTTLLNAIIREAFVAQYEEPVLERFREEIVEQLQAVKPELVEKLPPLPRTGSLDLAAVRDSSFFFA